MTASEEKVLVAGIGNVFLSDDGFGCAVARQLAAADFMVAPSVRVVDYGIRGLHLCYDLLDGYDALIVVDTVPGPAAPGDVVVLAVTADDLTGGPADPHGMDPIAVLSAVPSLGGVLPPTYVVGVVPVTVEEGMGLSPPVAAAVPAAADAVRELLGSRPWTARAIAAGRAE